MAARYASAEHLAGDLRAWLEGGTIFAQPVPFFVRGFRWCLRNPGAAAALALLTFIAVAGPVAAAWQRALRARAERDEAVQHFQRVADLLGSRLAEELLEHGP
jgi:serine/threonine-protein kinase